MGADRLVDVLEAKTVAPGTMTMVEVDGVNILVLNVDDKVLAVQGACTHEYFDLDQGEITGSTLTCGLHYSAFDVRDGSVLSGPAGLPLVTYPALIEDGRILLLLPEGEIPVNE